MSDLDSHSLASALDALAAIWANALINGDSWTLQRSAGVLTANRERLDPKWYAYPEWRELLAAEPSSLPTENR